MEKTKENLIVIIPAYEPPKEFVEYAKSVCEFAKKVVVVNDGSNEKYDCIFNEIARQENVVYLTYAENHGKGYALKTAFKYCSENFDENDIVVTADCDGQHKQEDIVNVYKACVTHLDAFIMGSRDLNAPNVPKRSKMGNQSIKRMFKFLYGLKLYDSQTGLRGCSVKLCADLAKIKGNRFDYEHSQLIYLKKRNIEILEIPIQTIYPENVEDHVSHFRTFKDSVNVFWVMIKNLAAYFGSSAVSSVLDVAAFYLLAHVILVDISAVNTLIATISARVLSSIVNFTLNYKFVFNGMKKRSIIKYYILWACQLGASYSIVFLFGNVIGWNLTIVKVIGDLGLAILSYQIQRSWVFRKKNGRKFYGGYANLVLKFGRKFSKEYRCNVLPYNEPVVYVCRHLDMHGPYTTLKWLKFDAHPMILSKFFTQKDCYNQYKNYTFTERKNKKKPRFSFKAFVSSIAVVNLVKSLKGIPVYREPLKTIKTFRKSINYLTENESLIVYPDIEYTAQADHKSDIYEGFLFLGELYFKKTGKHLKFVPVYIDEKTMSINECDAAVIDNFKQDKLKVKEYLIEQINRG